MWRQNYLGKVLGLPTPVYLIYNPWSGLESTLQNAIWFFFFYDQIGSTITKSAELYYEWMNASDSISEKVSIIYSITSPSKLSTLKEIQKNTNKIPVILLKTQKTRKVFFFPMKNRYAMWAQADTMMNIWRPAKS